MKKSNIALVILMSLGVVACGSSGGDNSAQPTYQPTQANKVTSPTGGENLSANSTGGAFSVDGNLNAKEERINAANANTIVVDGTTIEVRRPGIYAGGWMSQTPQKAGAVESHICCGKYSDAYIGVYEGGPDNKYVVYYNGAPTALDQIPQSGTATYVGDAIYNSTRELDKDFYKGTSNFTADFDAKTLNGALTFEAINTNIAIESSMNGNNFAGTATSNADPDVAKVEGKFYGENAKQLAGMAVTTTNLKVGQEGWNAAFIAKEAK